MLDDGPSLGLHCLLLSPGIALSGWDAAASPLLAALVCLGLSAFLSGAEAGFLALSRIQVLELAEQGNPKAILLLRILEKPAELVSSLLVANTTINVMMALLWATAMESLLRPLLPAGQSLELIQFLLELIVLTGIVVVLAEVTPKAIAYNHPLWFCSTFAGLMPPIMLLARPAVWIFQTISRAVLRLFGIKS
ncbi:MAG: DUF21 domain-containing protein, partial [bacterium]